jgi:hypothetical protein
VPCSIQPNGHISTTLSAMASKCANAPGPVIGFYRIGMATLVLLPVFHSLVYMHHLM